MVEEKASGTVETEFRDGVAVLQLVGEHDIATDRLLREQILRAVDTEHGVVVSLADTKFIDSAVTHTLFNGDKLMRAEGRRLVLHIRTASIVRRVLEISGLAQALPCTGSLETAITLASAREGGSRWTP